MKTFVGIDYHKAYSYGTVLDLEGHVLRQGRFSNTPDALADFLGEHSGQECAAVLEATRNWCVMHDWLEEAVGEVTLAHPMKVRAIAEARIKTDKIDATTLAHLLRCDLVPRAHVCSASARVIKNLLRHRMFLVRVQTMTKNRIHVLLDRYPHIRQQRVAEELFTGAGIGWLRSVQLATSDQRILGAELDLLENLRQQIRQAESWLAQVGQDDVRVRRLRTIPGIGKTLALLLVSEIDDIARFATPAKLHAYAGLVPSTYASGGKVLHGRIIKAGNKYIRWAMVEAVWSAMRKDSVLARMHEQLTRRKGNKCATVAAARRLLTIVYRVLREGRDWRCVP
jgi:transposase